MKELLKHWNITGETLQLHPRAWSIDNHYILKANDKLSNITRNITMMKSLAEYGIPVSNPIPTINGQDYIEANGVYYILMNKLPGTHVKDVYKKNDMHIAYDTGKIIATLHQAFIACEQKVSFWDNDLIDEMTGWIQVTLKEHQYRYITVANFDTCLIQLNNCYDKLPRQLIHRDLHFGNILFNHGSFSGYIDFDLSQKNIRIFDICYFLLGLLIDHHSDCEDIEKWYDIVSNFITGYEQVSILSELEKASMPIVMQCIELLFVSYFLSRSEEELAKGSADLYYFVKNNKKRLHGAIQKAST